MPFVKATLLLLLLSPPPPSLLNLFFFLSLFYFYSASLKKKLPLTIFLLFYPFLLFILNILFTNFPPPLLFSLYLLALASSPLATLHSPPSPSVSLPPPLISPSLPLYSSAHLSWHVSALFTFCLSWHDISSSSFSLHHWPSLYLCVISMLHELREPKQQSPLVTCKASMWCRLTHATWTDMTSLSFLFHS